MSPVLDGRWLTHIKALHTLQQVLLSLRGPYWVVLSFSYLLCLVGCCFHTIAFLVAGILLGMLLFSPSDLPKRLEGNLELSKCYGPKRKCSEQAIPEHSSLHVALEKPSLVYKVLTFWLESDQRQDPPQPPDYSYVLGFVPVTNSFKGAS